MRSPQLVFIVTIAIMVCALFDVSSRTAQAQEENLSEAWASQKSVTFDFGDSAIRLTNHHELFSFATGAPTDWSASDEHQEPIEITQTVTTGSVDVSVEPFAATASAVATWGVITSETQGEAELYNTVAGTAHVGDEHDPTLVAVSWGSHTSSVELGEEISQGVIDWTPAISVGTGGGAFVSPHSQIKIDDPLIVRTRNELGELSAPVRVFEFSATFDSETRFQWNRIRDIVEGVDGPEVITVPNQDAPFLDAGSRGTGSFSLSFQSDLIPAANRGGISVSFVDGIVTSSTATGAFADVAPIDGGGLEVGGTRLPMVGGMAMIDDLLPVVEGAPVADSNQRFRLEVNAGSNQVINDAAACSDGVQVTVGPAIDMVQSFTIDPLQRVDELSAGDVGPGTIGEVPGPGGVDPIGTACLGSIAEDAGLLFGTDYDSRGDVSLFAGPNASPIDRVLRFRSTQNQPRQAAFFEDGLYDPAMSATEPVHRWTARFDVRTLTRRRSNEVLPPIDSPPIDSPPTQPGDPQEPGSPDATGSPDEPAMPGPVRTPQRPPTSDSDIRFNPDVAGAINTAGDTKSFTVAPVAENLSSPKFVLAMLERNEDSSNSATSEAEQRLFEQKVDGLLFSVLEDEDVPVARVSWKGQLVGERVLDPKIIHPENRGWRYFDVSLTQVAKGLNVEVHAVDESRQVIETIIERTIPNAQLSRLGYRLAVGATGSESRTDQNANDDANMVVIHDFDNFLTAFRNQGDVAWDQKLDKADFDLFEEAWHSESTDPLFDLNFDGVVDVVDVEAIEDMIPNKIPGDANFDGRVRFDDFLKLSRYYGTETGLIPTVFPMFWAFRIMVGLGFMFIVVMAYFFWMTSFRGGRYPRWALRCAVAIIPTPWIAAELGWFVAEYGRQPWTVDGVLPTAMSVSHLSVTELLVTLAGFITFYTALFVIEMGLMLHYIRKGPFLDVTETQTWMAMHEHRLRTHDGKFPVTTPAE